MCGIAGFINLRRSDVSPGACLSAMTASLAHRGPDDEGYWVGGQAGVALGHRRLSIVDLSFGFTFVKLGFMFVGFGFML